MRNETERAQEADRQTKSHRAGATPKRRKLLCGLTLMAVMLGLVSSGYAQEPLVERLLSSSERIRNYALDEFKNLDADSKKTVVTRLIEALKDKDDQRVQMSAAVALGTIGPAAKDAVPALIQALKYDQSSEVRGAALSALAGIGPAARDAVPALIQALKYDEADIREGAVRALGDLRPVTREAVLAIVQALNDRNRWVRLVARNAFAHMGPAAKEGVPTLVQWMTDSAYSRASIYASDALGDMRDSAAKEEAVRALEQAIEDAIGDDGLTHMNVDVVNRLLTRLRLLTDTYYEKWGDLEREVREMLAYWEPKPPELHPNVPEGQPLRSHRHLFCSNRSRSLQPGWPILGANRGIQAC